MNVSRSAFVAVLLSPLAALADDHSPLQARLIVDGSMGVNSAEVVLSNPSGDFICIDDQMFDTSFSHILLVEKSGKYARQLSFTDPVPNAKFGFDYIDSYIFILPGETRHIGVDLRNFKVERGAYGYEILFYYYRCRDVIDRARIKAKKNIEKLWLQTKGTVSLPFDK